MFPYPCKSTIIEEQRSFRCIVIEALSSSSPSNTYRFSLIFVPLKAFHKEILFFFTINLDSLAMEDYSRFRSTENTKRQDVRIMKRVECLHCARARRRFERFQFFSNAWNFLFRTIVQFIREVETILRADRGLGKIGRVKRPRVQCWR